MQKTAYAIAGTLMKSARPGATSICRLVEGICAAQVAYGMPVFEPDPRLCHQLDQLLAMPLRRALRLPKHTSAVGVLSEFGLLSTEGLFGKSALWFRRVSKPLTPDVWALGRWRNQAQQGGAQCLSVSGGWVSVVCALAECRCRCGWLRAQGRPGITATGRHPPP